MSMSREQSTVEWILKAPKMFFTIVDTKRQDETLWVYYT